MRIKTVIAIMLACTAAGFAQEHMADSLRNGILEEDSKQRPAVAIQQYQAVLTQFAEARQTAATALFRMAECYRKQGNRPQAIAAYQRVLKEFADQPKLAGQSRTLLATTYKVTPDASPEAGNQSDKAKFDQLMEEQHQERAKEEAKYNDARARYRATILEEMDLDEKQLSLVKERQKAGEDGPLASGPLEEKIVHLKRDLAAFDGGIAVPTGR
jgi:hypothetical protein